jgi:DNA replication protein DnaC
MQATALIEAERVALEAQPETPTKARRLAWFDSRLAMARERDELQRSRPEGCWCLGAGSDGERTCGCAEGQAAADEQAKAREIARHNRHEELQERAEIPTRYWPARFHDSKIAVPSEVRRWVEFVADMEDDGAKNSVLLTGAYGTGKTWLATAALQELIFEHDHPCMFITTAALLDRIRASFDADKYNPTDDGDLLERVQNVYALVLDDIGAERVTEWVAERLFALVNARYNALLPTIFTSNLGPKELAGHLGERTAWRIVEMCRVVRLDGPNLRAVQ